LNGEITDREKAMRGLRKEDSPILKECQVYHNYVRRHEGLGGYGIKVEGKNNFWNYCRYYRLLRRRNKLS